MQQLDESLGSKGMNRMKGGECRVVHHSDRAIDQAEQDVASYEEIEEPKNFYGKIITRVTPDGPDDNSVTLY